MIPFVDHPRDPRHTPWATFGLIALNLVIGVVTLPLAWGPWQLPSNHPILERVPELIEGVTRLQWLHLELGFSPAQPSLLTALVSMFLHAGAIHLFGNMLYLWVYGPNVERRLGRLPFLLLYLTGGLLGTMLYALVSLGSPVPMIGASGAISGILGAYLVFFPRNEIRVWVFLTTLRLPAWIVLAIYAVLDNVLPFLLPSETVVAHAAHLGGFFGGMVLAFGLATVSSPDEEEEEKKAEPPPPGIFGRTPQPVPRGTFYRVDQLVHQGMLLDAHRELRELAEAEQTEVAAEARRRMEVLERDESFQRASRYAADPRS